MVGCHLCRWRCTTWRVSKPIKIGSAQHVGRCARCGRPSFALGLHLTHVTLPMYAIHIYTVSIHHVMSPLFHKPISPSLGPIKHHQKPKQKETTNSQNGKSEIIGMQWAWCKKGDVAVAETGWVLVEIWMSRLLRPSDGRACWPSPWWQAMWGCEVSVRSNMTWVYNQATTMIVYQIWYRWKAWDVLEC